MHLPRDGNGAQASWRIDQLLDKARIELPNTMLTAFASMSKMRWDRPQRDGLIADHFDALITDRSSSLTSADHRFRLAPCRGRVAIV
jgi:hypothetical protein